MEQETELDGKRVLVVEDDVFVREMIELAFARAGAEVTVASDGSQGLQRFYEQRPDLVILDIMMPHTSGWETCRQIRQLSDTPIIICTAIIDEDAIVRGLDMGAIDYVTKPFSTKVLLARARAAMRQSTVLVADEAAFYEDETLSIDIASRRVFKQGEALKLTKTEQELLFCLVKHRRQLLTFDQILDQVWGVGYGGSVEYVHVYISRLRKRLEADPKNPRYILSEHGIGYRFGS